MMQRIVSHWQYVHMSNCQRHGGLWAATALLLTAYGYQVCTAHYAHILQNMVVFPARHPHVGQQQMLHQQVFSQHMRHRGPPAAMQWRLDMNRALYNYKIPTVSPCFLRDHPVTSK